MRILLLIFTIVVLSGCVAGKEQYNGYLAAKQQQAVQAAVEEQKRSERWQKMAEACNGDPQCIRDVARDATLSDAIAALGKSGSGAGGDIQQFVVQAHPGTTALTSLGGIALTQGIQGAVNIRASDNSRRVAISSNELQAATTQGAYNLGAAAVNANASAVTAVATTLPQLQPSITAGGSIVGRDQIDVGGSLFGDNGHNGNVGPVNNGTQISNSGVIGSGRQASPGPFRDIGNGPRCEGAECQPVSPPPVDPEG